MKGIIIIGIVIFSLNILADIIIVIGKLLDQYELDNSCVSVTIITDIFWLVFFILFLTQL
jgi:hypothetical protein